MEHGEIRAYYRAALGTLAFFDERLPTGRLIFLSAEDLKLQFRGHGDTSVVTRDTFVEALTHHNWADSDQEGYSALDEVLVRLRGVFRTVET